MHQSLSNEDLESLSETSELEFKKALGQRGTGELPKDFWATYSAFANTHGGDIFLGVEERIPAGGLIVHHLKDWAKMRQDLFNLVNNRQKVSACVISDGDVEVVQVEEKSILRVHVPQASRLQRPVFVGENPLRGTYVRRNEADQLLGEADVKRMLAEQMEDSRDNRVLPNFTVQDIEIKTVEAYRQVFAARAPTHPFVGQPLGEFLRSLNAYRMNRDTGEEGLTLAGLLMFGKLNSILEAVPNYVVDYQERAAPRTEQRWVDRVTTDGSWSGNLYDFYTRVYAKLTADLKVPFKNESGVRSQVTPVHEALQEALVNTLIHADYSGRVSILIVKRPDMFGFRNPGLMRIPFELARVGGNSDCRNRHIQKMFQHAGAGDQAGSGVPRIYGVWKTQSWREPFAHERLDPEQTLFELRMASLLPEEKVRMFEEKYDDRFRLLSHEDKLVLVSAAVDGLIDHRKACGLTNQHPADVTKQLGRLTREGFLITDGRGRGTVYYSAEGIDAAELLGFEDVSGSAPSNLQGKLPSFQTLGASFQGFDGQSAPDGRLTGRVAALFPAGMPRRVDRAVMRATILSLLDGDFVTIKELAAGLSRAAEFLRNDYLRPLIEEGEVELRYAENPSHPQQAYRTKKGQSSRSGS